MCVRVCLRVCMYVCVCVFSDDVFVCVFVFVCILYTCCIKNVSLLARLDQAKAVNREQLNHERICVYIYIYTHVYTHARYECCTMLLLACTRSLFMCVRMHEAAYVCAYVYTYIHTYIHTDIHNLE